MLLRPEFQGSVLTQSDNALTVDDRHIAEQEARIDRLTSSGRDVTKAKESLTLFREMRKQKHKHLGFVLDRLGLHD